MTELYRSINKTSFIFAPSFVRQRHRYRGQRETLKMNSEIMAFRYDITRIYERYDRLLDLLLASLQKEVDGGSVAAQYLFADDPPVASLHNFTFDGIASLSARIQSLRDRVGMQERLG